MDIKICGLKNAETLAVALDRGASHVGFVFFAPSPRNVGLQEAGALIAMSKSRARSVAVTVDADDETLRQIMAIAKPDWLQLHGQETPQRLLEIKERHRVPVMKALKVAGVQDLEPVRAYLDVADRLMLDAKPPSGSELPGGNGVAFDWSVLDALDPAVPYMLSGGINAQNVSGALDRPGVSGIDVSSGVEETPGEKSVAAIDRFFDSVETFMARNAA